jgi:Mn-dependent DtxR family transcriptional regulator
MEKESFYFRFLLEDILRFGLEKGLSVSVEEIEEETGVDRDDVRKAVRTLLKKGLVEVRKERIYLTDRGNESAKMILQKHREIERVFKDKSLSESHKIAHSMEHFFQGKAKEEIDKILSMKKDAKRLTEIEEGTDGIIVITEETNPKVISRVAGIGLTPGVSFELLKKRRDLIILRLSGRIVALEPSIAKKTWVSRYR